MTKKNKKLILQIIVSLAILVISWFIINIIGQFLSNLWVQGILAAIITWVIISMGDRIGLPGFSDKKNIKKSKK
ncbi:MAG: hypothetical protein ACOX7D_01555 [Alphaproteobacteria bacterium]|jgi:hypothetical protein